MKSFKKLFFFMRHSFIRWCTIFLTTCVAWPSPGQLITTPLPPNTRLDQSEIVAYADKLYMVLVEYRAGHYEYYLYSYDGASFTRISTPPGYYLQYRCPLEVYGGKLYIVMSDLTEDPVGPPAHYKLFSYDGMAFDEISLPFEYVFLTPYGADLAVYQNRLYIDVADRTYDNPSSWVTYDGTGFSQIPYPVGMRKYGGTGMTVYNDKLYGMMAASAAVTPRLVSFDGSAFEFFDAPELVTARMGIFNNDLILHQGPGYAGDRMLRFDGTDFHAIVNPPNTLPDGKGKEVFNGNLFVTMQHTLTPAPHQQELYAYDGVAFTHIPTMAGAFFTGQDFEVWRCRLYFGLSMPSGGNLLCSYSIPSACASPPSSGPAAIADYKRIDIELFGHERGWCWNEIIIDWDIEPICPVPSRCPDPPIRSTLRDPKKIVWQHIAEKPFSVPMQVSDNPYTLTLAVEREKTIHDFLVVNNDLVGKGVEELKLAMKPRDNYVHLTVNTENGKSVPCTMSLLNANGAAVWQEHFVAPMSREIEIKSQEPGIKFLISSFSAEPTLKSVGITATKYYPNPFDGALTIDIQTSHGKIPVRVTIHDANGHGVLEEDLVAPVKKILELKNKKPGFYVLTFQAGGASRKELIEIR